MARKLKKRKIDRLWDSVFSLAEDDTTSGKLSYVMSDTVEGHIGITLDGIRYIVDIYPFEEQLRKETIR